MNRPAWFDDKLVAYRPGLRKLANRLTDSRAEADDLVNETITHALENWRSYRTDGGFWKWVTFIMRGKRVVAERAGRTTRGYYSFDEIDGDRYRGERHMKELSRIFVEPTQERAAELALLSRDLDELPTDESTVVRLYLAGFTLQEIGDELGFVREWVRRLRNRGFYKLARKRGVPAILPSFRGNPGVAKAAA
jgi:RNA polymerase sigma factor (sigma-70 family)